LMKGHCNNTPVTLSAIPRILSEAVYDDVGYWWLFIQANK